jgi:hypothetical protein
MPAFAFIPAFAFLPAFAFIPTFVFIPAFAFLPVFAETISSRSGSIIVSAVAAGVAAGVARGVAALAAGVAALAAGVAADEFNPNNSAIPELEVEGLGVLLLSALESVFEIAADEVLFLLFLLLLFAILYSILRNYISLTG